MALRFVYYKDGNHSKRLRFCSLLSAGAVRRLALADNHCPASFPNVKHDKGERAGFSLQIAPELEIKLNRMGRKKKNQLNIHNLGIESTGIIRRSPAPESGPWETGNQVLRMH